MSWPPHLGLGFLVLALIVWGLGERYFLFSSGSRRRLKEQRAALFDLKLDQNAQIVEVPAPIFTRSVWRDHLAAAEKELAALGYRRLFCYQNRTEANVCRPNFSAVYVSPDASIGVALHYRLRAHQDAGKVEHLTKEAVSKDIKGSLVVTSFDAEHVTWRLGHAIGEDRRSADTSVAELVAEHERRVHQLPWTPLPFVSSAAYLECLHAFRKSAVARHRHDVHSAVSWDYPRLVKRYAKSLRSVRRRQKSFVKKYALDRLKE